MRSIFSRPAAVTRLSDDELFAAYDEMSRGDSQTSRDNPAKADAQYDELGSEIVRRLRQMSAEEFERAQSDRRWDVGGRMQNEEHRRRTLREAESKAGTAAFLRKKYKQMSDPQLEAAYETLKLEVGTMKRTPSNYSRQVEFTTCAEEIARRKARIKGKAPDWLTSGKWFVDRLWENPLLGALYILIGVAFVVVPILWGLHGGSP
jgi:hypothetical protein